MRDKQSYHMAGLSTGLKRITGIMLLLAGLALAAGCIIPEPLPTQEATGNLVIFVQDMAGNSLWGAKVVSSSQPPGQPLVSGITTQPDGKVEFDNIFVGDYRFTVSRFDYLPQDLSITVMADETATSTVKLSSAAPSPVPSLAASQYKLEYQLLSNYPDVFWCDPDFYPVARQGQEEKNAEEQFAAIRANKDEFAAILQKLGLPQKPDYSADEKLAIYREHKTLTYAAQMTPAPSGYDFVLRTGKNQGLRIEGNITFAGKVTVKKQETSFNTCPICLPKGTFIATPDGASPVEELRPGQSVWTLDASGQRVAAEIIKTSATLVPVSFQIVRITLSDGRIVSASPGHPTADNVPLSDYHAGDSLNGAAVISAELVYYNGGATYDILPAGATGTYWANGVLLKSTLW